MQHFIVTASWDPEPCFEDCEESIGQTFVFVRARDGKEAVEVARERLLPSPYRQARYVAAVPLALPVSPQAHKAIRIAEREMHVRTSAYVTELKPEQGGQ